MTGKICKDPAWWRRYWVWRPDLLDIDMDLLLLPANILNNTNHPAFNFQSINSRDLLSISKSKIHPAFTYFEEWTWWHSYRRTFNLINSNHHLENRLKLTGKSANWYCSLSFFAAQYSRCGMRIINSCVGLFLLSLFYFFLQPEHTVADVD